MGAGGALVAISSDESIITKSPAPLSPADIGSVPLSAVGAGSAPAGTALVPAAEAVGRTVSDTSLRRTMMFSVWLPVTMYGTVCVTFTSSRSVRRPVVRADCMTAANVGGRPDSFSPFTVTAAVGSSRWATSSLLCGFSENALTSWPILAAAASGSAERIWSSPPSRLVTPPSDPPPRTFSDSGPSAVPCGIFTETIRVYRGRL